MEIKLCKTTIEYKNPVAGGGFSYTICNKKAKYKITYKRGTDGKLVTEYLCGTHFKAFEKRSKTIFKRTGFNNELKYEIINS